MDIAELLTFIKVAETESFSEAAERLFLTQPAVSKRIAALESNLSVRLFDRIGRQVQLTEAGRKLLPKAKQIAEDLADIKRSMSLQMEDVVGELQVVTSHHIGLHRLPSTLKRFEQDYSNAKLMIEFTQSEEAYRRVVKGEAELGVITLSQVEDSQIAALHIWSDTLACVVSPEHPLAKLPIHQLSVIELAQYECVLPHENTFTRQIAEKVFLGHGVKPKVRMNTNNLQTLAMLAGIGWGWSLIPATMVTSDLIVLNIEALKIERKLGVIYHRQRTLSRAAQAFIDLVRLHADSAAPTKLVQ
ncbi:LysR family transcriptional regulator [Maribrevibacterium harenarium]|nr:LysR family transcriptional regulator [Maribrevibacterium harenarium]